MFRRRFFFRFFITFESEKTDKYPTELQGGRRVMRGLKRIFLCASALASASLAVSCAQPAPKKERPRPPTTVQMRPAAKIQSQNLLESQTQTAAKVFSENKSAVVKILLKKSGQPVSFGAGFFVSSDGKLVTNRHVMADLLRSPQMTVEFQLVDGKTTISRYTIGGCSDERDLDLCVLKLDHRPQRWIDPVATHAKPGEKVFVIGHPEGFEYSFSDGIISAVRELEHGIKYVQFTASISQGNSGGPVLNERGQLLGISTKFAVEGQNLNFAISSSEIIAYLNSHSKFLPRQAYVDLEINRTIDLLKRNMMRRWTSPLDRAEAPSAAGKAPRIGDPMTYEFPVDNDTVFVPAPIGLFDECGPVSQLPIKSSGCRDLRTRTAFVVSSGPLMPVPLLKLGGKIPEAPRVHESEPGGRPVPLGASLPLPRVCRKASEFRRNTLAGKGSGVCFSMIRNFGKPGAFKLITEIESLGRVYLLVFASDEARLFEYAKTWMQFAAYNAVSVRQNDPPPNPSPNSPLTRGLAGAGPQKWPFQVWLPARYKDFGVSQSANGPIYTAKASGPDYFVSIIPVTPGVPPKARKKFKSETVADETSKRGATVSRPKIDKSTAVIRDLEGGQGFIIAGRGALEANKHLIFQGVIYSGSTTYIVSGIAPWAKRAEASPELVRILRSLKPQPK